MIKDTPYGYGLVSKTLHWLIALLILSNLAVVNTKSKIQIKKELPCCTIQTR